MALLLLCAGALAAVPASSERPDIVWEATVDREVNFVAFSPDGSTIASAGIMSNTVKLWRASTGELIRALEGCDTPLSLGATAFSPDGSMIASAGWSAPVRVWSASTGDLICALEDSDTVYSFVFSPDGKVIASAKKDGKIRFWRTSDGKLIRALEDDGGYIVSVAFSPDGRLLAYGRMDGRLVVARNPLAAPPAELVRGDSDGDGKVTIADAVIALRIAVGLERGATHQLMASDLNGDGKVDLSDVTRILRAAVALGVL